MLYGDSDKYEAFAEPAPILEATHAAIKDLFRRRFSESGVSWREFVFGESYKAVTEKDIKAIDRMLIDSGYRYRGSATISVKERPDAYQGMAGIAETSDEFTFSHPEAVLDEADQDGRQRCGQGDNVVKHSQNAIGYARYYRSVEDVMNALSNGVPDETIAIIDDSGGTLTAPILEKFKAVICAGGTVRSHLGILTREYSVPCVMAAKIDGIYNGDKVEVGVSGEAKTAEAYASGIEMSVPIWKLTK